MPVFEFDRDSSPARILEEHFRRLWAISQDDMKTLAPLDQDNLEAAKRLDTHVFGIRKEVLNSLVELLSKAET